MAEQYNRIDPGEGVTETLGMKLVRKLFGGLVRVKQSNGTTGTVATQIVDNNPDRIGLEVINNSAAAIYIGFRADTSATNSVILAAGGGSMVLKFRDDGQVAGHSVYALSAGGGDEYTIIETILWGK